MKRYAQLYYGEVIYIYETERTMEELSEIFDPKTFWVDITDQYVQIGYVQGIRDDKMVLVPKDSIYSIEQIKKAKEVI